MRKLLSFFFALAVTVGISVSAFGRPGGDSNYNVAIPSGAQISLVAGQVSGPNTSFASVTTNTATLPNNPGAGHLVLVCVAINDAGAHTPITIKDGDNNSYTLTTSSPYVVNQSGNVYNLVAGYLQNAPAPVSNSKAITATWTTAVAGSAIWAVEFQGAATTSAFESDSTSQTATASTTISAPSITTTNNGDVLLNCIGGSGGSLAVGSPWTEINSGYYNGQAGASYFVQSTAGAQAANYTQGSGNSGGISASFKH
jgi:hypothetical protein